MDGNSYCGRKYIYCYINSYCAWGSYFQWAWVGLISLALFSNNVEKKTSNLSSIVYCYRLFLHWTAGTFHVSENFFLLIFPWNISRALCWERSPMNRWKQTCLWTCSRQPVHRKSQCVLCRTLAWKSCCCQLKVCTVLKQSLNWISSNCFDSASPLRKQVKLSFLFHLTFCVYRFLVSLSFGVVWTKRSRTISTLHSFLCSAKWADG